LLGNFSGVAPMMIQVGSAEILFDDSIALAAAAGAAGVSVNLQVWADMIHVWQYFYPNLTAGREALAEAGQYIRSHFR
jgi:acetyl esterase/lipase